MEGSIEVVILCHVTISMVLSFTISHLTLSILYQATCFTIRLQSIFMLGLLTEFSNRFGCVAFGAMFIHGYTYYRKMEDAIICNISLTLPPKCQVLKNN
jgi:hypothetical protein